MIIKIDNRERKLITLMKALKKDLDYNFDIVVEVLDLGDIIICDDNVEKLIIERKSLSDLAASIKDGRYSEQSFRLNGIKMHNHNIVYLIEGDIHKYNNKYNKIKASTLQVTMFCLQYFKGFSVFKTRDVMETAEYILRITNKLQKEKKRENYYDGTNTFIDKSYTDVVKRVKKKNIVPENVGEIILSQIPGISSKTSKVVMAQFNSLYDMLEKIKNDKHCLDNVEFEMANGKKRKISQTTVNNIRKYLLYRKDDPVIKIDV
uniref:ERCC4 domain-containing protein n=1 Tax=viral metagenome TaxID=1070528 RepID=A0A6C0F6X5_9ZZZZ|tara:strand:- start:268 stop:1053 length:786 start_codon:yes stop_codon:yes gene_type:complete